MAKPRGTAVPPLDKIFVQDVYRKRTGVPGENLVGSTVPSDTVVPMIFHKSIKTTTTSVQVLVPSPKWRQANQRAKIYLGETPFSIKEGMSIQTTLLHLVYLFWKKENVCFNHVLEILSIPSLWKWWMVAMLKFCKNLVHIFVLYAFLNLLVYCENKILK
jgi:hypothetical protein